MPRLRQRDQALRMERQAIAEQTQDRAAYLRLAETLSAFLERLRAAADTLDIAERQRIVRLVVKEVLVDDDTIAIRHSIPVPSGPPSGGRVPPSGQAGDSGDQQSYLLRTGRGLPLLSSILLTPFDREMRRKGYHLTRYADDWVVTCRTRAEAVASLQAAANVLGALGVTLHPSKTRIVHVRYGFAFLGYKIKRGERPLRLRADQIKIGIRRGDVYAFPRQKSVDHFKDQIRKLTCRKAPVTTQALIDQINPIIRGWGNDFCKAHVRTLFARLDRWIIRRIHAHRYKRWRCRGYRTLPERKLYGEDGLVRLIALIPSISLPQAPL